MSILTLIELQERMARKMQDAIDAIQKFGFPIVMAVGMGYYIYYIWKYVTEQITPKLEKSHLSLIKVIDQVRMLDNDLIRLQQKVNVVLEYEKRHKSGNSNNSFINSSDNSGSRPDDSQIQEPVVQRDQHIKSLLDDRESRDKPKKRAASRNSSKTR